jgi:putative peptidoglycan lipid II flippase
MGVSVLLSRVTGLVREMVLAGFGGTGSEVDAYVAAFLIPELMNHFLAGGFLAVTFIPLFHAHVVAGRYDRAWKSFSNILTCGTVVLAVLLLAGMVFTDDLLIWIQHLNARTSGTEDLVRGPQWVALTVKMTRIVLPAQLFLYWGSFLMAVQYAHQRYLLPALMPLCYNVGIIAGGVLLGPVIGIEGFAWGVLGGAFIGGVLVQSFGTKAVGVRYVPRIALRDPDLRRFVFLSFPFVIGIGMHFSIELFRFFGLFLSKGTIASLNYAVRIMMIVVAFLGQTLSTASYPFFSRYAAEKNFTALWRLSRMLVQRVSVCAIAVSAVMIALAPQIVSVLLERGAFEMRSTQQTAALFSIYSTAVFALAANTIVMRCFFAVQNTVLPMLISTGGLVVSLPFYVLLMPRWGARGIAAAASLCICIQFFSLYILWCARNQRIQWFLHYMAMMVKAGGIAACGWAIAFYIRHWLQTIGCTPGTPFVTNVFLICAGALPACGVIGLLYHYTGILTVTDIRKIVTRRKKAPSP